MHIRFVVLTLVSFSLIAIAQAGTDGHQQPDHTDDRLRAAIIRELGEVPKDLKYSSQEFDLNDDGRAEVLVWVPTIGQGGTSGYPLFIFSKTQRGYRLLWQFDQAWTPVIVLNSSQHHWRDIVFQIGGGGERMRYVLVRHTGESYSHKYTFIDAKRIRGHRVIGKDWKPSVMGPIPQQ